MTATTSHTLHVVLTSPSRGTDWPTVVVAVGAILSPIVAFLVALLVTAKTISNDKAQRDQDRTIAREAELRERRVSATADFAQRAESASSLLRVLSPSRRVSSAPRTSDARAATQAVAEVRRALVVLNIVMGDDVFKAARTDAEQVAQSLSESESSLHRWVAASRGALLTRQEAMSRNIRANDTARKALEKFLVSAARALGAPGSNSV